MMKLIKEYTSFCKDTFLSSVLHIGARAALKAGDIIKGFYGRHVDIKFKGDIDLVTEADLASEAAILEIIKKEMPESGIISEEGNHGFDDQEGMLWLVDPLDGTTNFAHGFPWFAVSIALYHKKKALAGIVYAPLQNEFFCAAFGQGAWLNGEKIAVSASSDLKTSLLATGFPYDIHVSHDQVVEALKRALTRAQGIRRAGAAAMDLAYVSCGRLDGFWEIKLKPWDTAAGKLLVEEAGGRITDFRKGSYTPFVPEILATNRIIHNELSEILKDFSKVQ